MCRILKLSKTLTLLPVLGLTALLLVPASGARAAADYDGAMSALISLPLDFVGDVYGGLGLMGAAVIGAAGDVLALVDDNAVTRPYLRAGFSRAFKAGALAVSHTASGALEGGRGQQLAAFPEPATRYLKRGGKISHKTEARLGTLQAGFSAAGPLAIADVLTNTALVFTRLMGSEEADSLATWQSDFRGHMIGKTELPAVAAR